jgi:4-diphosphocytidyl-2-C-methyl-D-erythritol kinase
VRVFAPAKVNLALHVTGKREDGYHLLDSLVVFAGIGDRIDLAPAPDLSLVVKGPRAAGVPADGRNLAWRAAEAMGSGGVAITLEKALPHAGGIGGGSADAGAVLRGLAALRRVDLPPREVQLKLGADVPVCTRCRPARMRGIGERVDPVPPLPPVWLVLVNPGVEVPTAAVFAALGATAMAPMPEPAWHDLDRFLSWLGDTRNDLEQAATGIVPEVAAVLSALRGTGACRLARMSGSGGTCFGLFENGRDAEGAADALREEHPGWWIEAAPVLAHAP